MNAIATPHKVDNYADLVHQIRIDLRLQHPEWIEPNGESPMCDSYEARLIKSFPTSIPTKSSGNMVGSVIFRPWRTRKIPHSSFSHSLPIAFDSTVAFSGCERKLLNRTILHRQSDKSRLVFVSLGRKRISRQNRALSLPVSGAILTPPSRRLA
jgi:hypothetical protein